MDAGKAVLLLRSQKKNYTYARKVKPSIFKVNNVSVDSVYCVTEHTACSLLQTVLQGTQLAAFCKLCYRAHCLQPSSDCVTGHTACSLLQTVLQGTLLAAFCKLRHILEGFITYISVLILFIYLAGCTMFPHFPAPI